MVLNDTYLFNQFVNESWELVLNKVYVNESALEFFKVINTAEHNSTKQRKHKALDFEALNLG